MSSDPIADMLTIIRNGYLNKATKVTVSKSKFKEELLKVLVSSDFLENFKTGDKKIEITLKYENKKGAVEKIKKISKPGLRIYRSKKKFPIALSGFGVTIVSTSKGVMTAKEAKKKGLGGEVICQVW